MPSQYEVTRVHESKPWASQYGAMLGWTLTCRNIASGGEKVCEINSKPDKIYSVGDRFWADVTGERAGVPKLKRVQPPIDQGSTQGGPRSGGASQAPAQARSGAVDFNLALDVLMTCAAHVDQHAPGWATPEVRGAWSTSLFIAWNRGEISRPATLADAAAEESYRDAQEPEEDLPF